MINDSVKCSNCGAPIDTKLDIPGDRTPCPVCGKNRRTFEVVIEEKVIALDGLGVKAKRSGENRPYVEDKAIPSFSHRIGKYVLLNQVIDRDNNRYYEKVTDYDSGEVIHNNVEPLSEHQLIVIVIR